MSTLSQKIVMFSDRLMVGSFYITAFFLPSSSALTESFFGFILLAYLIKRGVLFFYAMRERSTVRTQQASGVTLFLHSYAPVAHPLSLPLGVYLFVCFVSIFLSTYPFESFRGFFFKLLQGAFLYLLFIEAINSYKRLRIFLFFFLFAMAVVSVNGVFQYLFSYDFMFHRQMEFGRVSSSFRHPNDFSGYLVCILPIVFTLSFLWRRGNASLQAGRGRAVQVRTFFMTSRWVQLALGVILAAGIFSLGVTYSRAAWIALAVALVFLSIRRPKMTPFFIVFMILFVMTFGQKMKVERQSNVQGPQGVLTTSDRVDYWRSSVTIIKAHPIVGIGLNAYSNAANDFRPALVWSGYPHNCYLQMAAEIGIPGLSVFLWILVSLGIFAIRQLNVMRDESMRVLLEGALAGLGAFLVQSFFDTSLYSVKLDTLFWIMLGLIVAVVNIEHQGRAAHQ